MWSALSQWSFDPVPVVGSVLAAALYALGGKRDLRALSFYTGLAVLFLALTSPLDVSNLRLQWVHMTQHVLLLLVAPPLILLGHPFTRAFAGLRRLRPELGAPQAWLVRAATAFRRDARGAALVLALFTVNLLVWHIPAIYNLTLQVEPVHDLEHTMFLLTGLWFWDLALAPAGSDGSLGFGRRAVLLLAAMTVSWALAIVIGYASQPLYAYPQPGGGLSPLQDKQLAAGVMWVPGSIPFVVALVYLLVAWFDADERAAGAAGASLPGAR